MKRRLGCVLLVILGSSFVWAEEALIGDSNDGNRYTPVHQMQLMDDTGIAIRAADADAKPFSMEKTCGQCHTFDVITHGWHFQLSDPQKNDGRPGQPFVLADPKTRTVLPISERNWPGVYSTKQLGMSQWEFISAFNSHIPGNHFGKFADAEDDPQVMLRKEISGSWEINCLACHNADFRQDQSLAALQAARQNFRWMNTAASGMAVVNGTASALSDFFDPTVDKGITVAYNPSIFDKDDKVFMNITANVPKERCYYCHSVQDMAVGEASEWTRDEDVHMHSGLNCTDCHRHGTDHQISRGYETENPNMVGFTCEGCHLGPKGQETAAGRLGSPTPKHAGIPTIHFEKMTCTACHSGPAPQETAGQVRTAGIHKLGLHGKHKVDMKLPHVYEPVLMKGQDGKIGPYRLIWPAFWAALDNNEVKPLLPRDVTEAVSSAVQGNEPKENEWMTLSEEQVTAILTALQSDERKTPVYICSGKMYKLGEDGKLLTESHAAAAPYAWPLAHDVRPKDQSLGAKSCADCHTTDSAFFFAKLPVDGPVPAGLEPVEMASLQGVSKLYVWAFNFSFVFRPWLKIVTWSACGLIALVLLLYGLKALSAITRVCVEDKA
ncbi:MAG: hypothetical protein ABFD91_01490 [Anaerohalosphaeraceae bacterium]